MIYRGYTSMIAIVPAVCDSLGKIVNLKPILVDVSYDGNSSYLPMMSIIHFVFYLETGFQLF